MRIRAYDQSADDAVGKPGAPPAVRGRCPELASVSNRELQELVEAVSVVAIRRTRSKAEAEDIVQRTFESLLTTRRWNPDRGPLAMHVIQIVKSVIHHHYESKAPRRERLAHDGFQHEIVGEEAASPQERLLEHAEDEERQSAAGRTVAELEERVAPHGVARGVLRCRREGLEKPAEIARALNVSVEQVYRGTELLRYHLQRIREGEKT